MLPENGKERKGRATSTGSGRVREVRKKSLSCAGRKPGRKAGVVEKRAEAHNKRGGTGLGALKRRATLSRESYGG